MAKHKQSDKEVGELNEASPPPHIMDSEGVDSGTELANPELIEADSPQLEVVDKPKYKGVGVTTMAITAHHGLYAYNLALSIAAKGSVPIELIATKDGVSKLSEAQLAIFKNVTIVEFPKGGNWCRNTHYRLLVADYSDFERGLYVECDSLAIDKLDSLLEYCEGKGFVANFANTLEIVQGEHIQDVNTTVFGWDRSENCLQILKTAEKAITGYNGYNYTTDRAVLIALDYLKLLSGGSFARTDWVCFYKPELSENHYFISMNKGWFAELNARYNSMVRGLTPKGLQAIWWVGKGFDNSLMPKIR